MDARALANRLETSMFPGPYARDTDVYADLESALREAVGSSAEVHVERQDDGALRSVQAFAQSYRPDAAVTTEGRRIGVEAKLLRRSQESETIAAAITQAIVLTLDYDEALIVFLTTGDAQPFTARERGMLDALWESYGVAWTSVPVRQFVGMGQRREPEPAAKGSQKWIQLLVNERPDLLEAKITEASAGRIRMPIQWVSPLQAEGYREYSDQEFLDRLGVRLEQRSLSSFWPTGGPRWDALGRSAVGASLLVEAKAHGPEAVSHCKASARSREQIERSLTEVQAQLGVEGSPDWTRHYYQYANRLAHLHLLREINDRPAWLVCLYFVGDDEMAGPQTAEEWLAIQDEIHGALGLRRDMLPHVLDVYVDVHEIAGTSVG